LSDVPNYFYLYNYSIPCATIDNFGAPNLAASIPHLGTDKFTFNNGQYTYSYNYYSIGNDEITFETDNSRVRVLSIKTSTRVLVRVKKTD
jgi:hypothetical protein